MGWAQRANTKREAKISGAMTTPLRQVKAATLGWLGSFIESLLPGRAFRPELPSRVRRHMAAVRRMQRASRVANRRRKGNGSVLAKRRAQ